MPKKRLRLLLVALLVAMIPVQGFAALSMGICRDLQRSADHLSQDWTAAAPVAHGHGHDAHGQPAGMAGNDAQVTGDPHSAHCAACAACGVSAGIDAQQALSIADAPRDGIVVHGTSQFSGFVPETLDRPPLTPHA